MAGLADSRGLSRRELIRASAVAGAGAWIAPTIIGSLRSPAAAQTAECTTFYSYQTQPDGDHVSQIFQNPDCGGNACTTGGNGGTHPAVPPNFNCSTFPACNGDTVNC